MVERMKKKDDFVADFWKRMGYVLGIGSAFVPGMVVGMELVMKDMEKSTLLLRWKTCNSKQQRLSAIWMSSTAFKER